MSVQRSEACATCDHREIEHDAVGARGCHKLGCRCWGFVGSGRARVVMPIAPKDDESSS